MEAMNEKKQDLLEVPTIQNKQTSVQFSAHQTSSKPVQTQNKQYSERGFKNQNTGRSKYTNQSKQTKTYPKVVGQDGAYKSHKSVQAKTFAAKSQRLRGAVPRVDLQQSDEKIQLQTKSVQTKTTKQTTVKKTSAQRQQPAQNLVETKMAIKQISQPSRNTKSKQPKPSIRAYFLGGLNEIGKNITLFECENDMIVVDCGMAFPDDDMLGVDLVIPDFTFIEKNIDKIRGIVVTQGHEDHIGAMLYLLKKVK